MGLRYFAVTATLSLAAFTYAAEAAHPAHHRRDPHRKDHHRHRHHARVHNDQGPGMAWRAGGVWKEDPWLTYNERDWLDSGGHWHTAHDRYWRPTFERREYVVNARVFATLKHHGYRHVVGDPFWYHGHYLVRTFRGRYVDLVEVNPYTGGYLGRVIS
jgi:hypothetical protein